MTAVRPEHNNKLQYTMHLATHKTAENSTEKDTANRTASCSSLWC